jgi:hypothetical protein
MPHRSSRTLAPSRRGGMLFLLDSDGQVIASQCESRSRPCSRSLPFGLKRVVDSIIAQSRDIFKAGEADFTIGLPLAVRIFSIKHSSSPTIALYIERASRRSD